MKSTRPRRRRGQAALTAIALIPLITLTALVFLAGIQAQRGVGEDLLRQAQEYRESLAETLRVSVEGTNISIMNTGAAVARISYIVVDNGTGPFIINYTETLYPGEAATLDLGILPRQVYVVTARGSVFKAQTQGDPLSNAASYAGRLYAVNVSYTGRFLGGYTVDLRPDSWSLIDKSGIVENTREWHFDNDDIGVLYARPAMPTHYNYTLTEPGWYVFGKGTLTQTSAGPSYVWCGKETVSTWTQQTATLDPSALYEAYVPPEGYGGWLRIRVSTGIGAIATYYIEVRDEAGLLYYRSETTATSIVFWLAYNPATGEEYFVPGSTWSWSRAQPAGGRIYVTPRSSTAAVVWLYLNMYHEATFVLEIDAETPHYSVTYNGSTYTEPLSVSGSNILPIYSESPIKVEVWYPMVATLTTETDMLELVSDQVVTGTVKKTPLGILLMLDNGTTYNLTGSWCNITETQNAVAYYEYVQTIGYITVLGAPAGSRISAANHVITVDSTPLRLPADQVYTEIALQVPLAAAWSQDGTLHWLPAEVVTDGQSYTVRILLTWNPARLAILVPSSTLVALANGTPAPLIDSGAWKQVVLDSPGIGEVTVSAYTYG